MKYTFAISFHRDNAANDKLRPHWIPSKVSEKRQKQHFLKEFKSVKRIKETSFEEIAAIIGEAKAKTVKEGLSNESSKMNKKPAEWSQLSFYHF